MKKRKRTKDDHSYMELLTDRVSGKHDLIWQDMKRRYDAESEKEDVQRYEVTPENAAQVWKKVFQRLETPAPKARKTKIDFPKDMNEHNAPSVTRRFGNGTVFALDYGCFFVGNKPMRRLLSIGKSLLKRKKIANADEFQAMKSLPFIRIYVPLTMGKDAMYKTFRRVVGQLDKIYVLDPASRGRERLGYIPASQYFRAARGTRKAKASTPEKHAKIFEWYQQNTGGVSPVSATLHRHACSAVKQLFANEYALEKLPKNSTIKKIVSQQRNK